MIEVGIATGQRAGVFLANIFLARCDQFIVNRFRSQPAEVYYFVEVRLLFYARYIDDTLLVVGLWRPATS